MSPTTIYNKQYHLQEKIAAGGFAQVYRAIDQKNGNSVALKVGLVHTDPGYAKSIIEEARILSRTNHPNIVKILPLSRLEQQPQSLSRPTPQSQDPPPLKSDVFCARAVEMSGQPYFFVMEYLTGGTLELYLKQVTKLTIPEATAIALEIARGLRHLHRLGFAHNDLKLENVVFRQELVLGKATNPVLVDFGIATRVRVQIEAGSLYVMSPEQLKMARMLIPPEMGNLNDPTKVDIWGIGVLLYRMLSGSLPFEGRNEKSLTERILNSQPQPLIGRAMGINHELDDFIVNGCLAKNPAQRPTMVELGKLLSRYGEGAVVTTPPGPSSPKRWFGR